MQCNSAVMEEILSCSDRDKKIVQIPRSPGWRIVAEYLRRRKDRKVIVSFHPIFGACVSSIVELDGPCILRYVENERNVDIDDLTPCLEIVQDHYIAKHHDTLQLVNMLRLACGETPFKKITDAFEVVDLESDNDDLWPPPGRVA